MPSNFNSQEKGVINLYLIVALVLIIIVLLIASKLQVVKTYPSKDISNVQGVLIAKGGDDDDSGSGNSGSGGSSNSGNSGSSDDDENDDSSQSSGSSGSSSSDTGANAPSPKPTFKPAATSGVRIKDDSNKDKTKTEIRFGEGEKIKTRVEDGRTRIDVYSGGVKVRYEIRDGRVIIKAETEDGEEVEGQDLFKIEDRLGKAGIKVATEGGKLVIARNNIGALSNFPLQLDLNTNQLVASTSAGLRVLTTLPDQAVQNMLAANVISRLDTQTLLEQAQLGILTSVSDVVALGERNGVPVYEINGLRDHRLLGFIPVTTQVTVVVSAQTGELITQEQSLLANVVDLLSP